MIARTTLDVRRKSQSSDCRSHRVQRHRSRRELVVENATLRHQLSVLRQTGGRPHLGLTDRLRLRVSAALLPAWRKAIILVQPETILKWHRAGFRLFWRHRSKPGNRARLNAEAIELIRNMAKSNRLWGTERIRGELRPPRIAPAHHPESMLALIAMAQLIVRDIPQEVVARLKQRAAELGHSAEAEHREILRRALLAPAAPSLKAMLNDIPDVGRESDFVRPRRTGRRVAL